MAKGYLQLSLSGLSVTISSFIGDGKTPRQKFAPLEPKRTQYGTYYVWGHYYEEGHIWECTAMISKAQMKVLDAMYFEYHRLRRTLQDPKILLIDTTCPFSETGSRTRATAPSPFNTVESLGGFVNYYPQFYVLFNRQPEFTQLNAKTYSATLSLLEDSVKVPA